MTVLSTLAQMHPDVGVLLTVVSYVFMLILSAVLSIRYAQRQFVRELKKSVHTEVKAITEDLEKELQIPLGSEDLAHNGQK